MADTSKQKPAARYEHLAELAIRFQNAAVGTAVGDPNHRAIEDREKTRCKRI